jgi:hypothetical protein
MAEVAGDDPTKAVAGRLRLPTARDQWNEPWRYWILRYLAALAEVNDFEGRPFERDDARVALETMRDDCDNLIALLSKRPMPRWRRRR